MYNKLIFQIYTILIYMCANKTHLVIQCYHKIKIFLFIIFIIFVKVESREYIFLSKLYKIGTWST